MWRKLQVINRLPYKQFLQIIGIYGDNCFPGSILNNFDKRRHICGFILKSGHPDILLLRARNVLRKQPVCTILYKTKLLRIITSLEVPQDFARSRGPNFLKIIKTLRTENLTWYMMNVFVFVHLFIKYGHIRWRQSFYYDLWLSNLSWHESNLIPFAMNVVLNFPDLRSSRTHHDDVITWNHFPHYWPFVKGIHWIPVF